MLLQVRGEDACRNVESSLKTQKGLEGISTLQSRKERNKITGTMLKTGEAQEASNPQHYMMSKMKLPVYEKYIKQQSAGGCGQPIPNQTMWFAGPGRCSLASADMMYFSNKGEWKSAKKGDIIDINCDDVQCPIPVIKDCYRSPEICGEESWCWIKQHEKWGPWAMGPDSSGVFGHTPNPEYCEKFVPAYTKEIQENNLDVNQLKILQASKDLFCPEKTVWGGSAWRPIHGQCVKYRTEQQSCLQQQDFLPPFVGYDAPRFAEDRESSPMERPLLCAPDLACTAPDFNVLPSTCVQKRPPNICYYGPWWDSSECPAEQDQSPGLSYDVFLDALLSAGLLYEGEVLWPGTCQFWAASEAGGGQAERIRHQVWLILSTMWPTAALKGKAAPSWKTFNDMIETKFDPISYLLNESISHVLLKENISQKGVLEVCQQMEGERGELSAQAIKVQELLRSATKHAMMPNKVWSIVHFTTFNLPDAATEEQAYASRALATLLGQNFWCDDCRSFFQVGVIEKFGAPPVENPSGHDIAKWWWKAHNVASEHVASTRMGHPWIHQFGDKVDMKGVKSNLQNPFYMSFEDAYNMWRVPPEALS